MRALVYADLQAGESNQRLFSAPAVSLQLHRVKRFFSELAKLAKRHRCDMVWDLGDTTDDRNAIPITVVDAVLAGLELLPTHETGNVKLIGNHEQWLRNGALHVGRLFDRKFNVVDQLHVVDVTPKVSLVCAAYPAEDAQLAIKLKAAIDANKRRQRQTVVLGHFQVLGCQLNSGQATAGVPVAAMHGADLALLGHVHRFQQVASQAFYVGSPFQQDFGEADDPEKRVGVVDLDTLQVEWHVLTGFPTYRSVSFDEFVRVASPDSEDRYQVLLRSHAETEQFYAHPLAVRAEPVYRYSVADEVAHDGQPVPDGDHQACFTPWTLRRAMTDYVKQAQHALAARKVDINSADLLKFGFEIVGEEA